MIKKEDIYVDMSQWEKEKNTYLEDAPVFNHKTGRRLNKRFKAYFKNVHDYFSSKNKKYLNWVDNAESFEKNKHLIQAFFKDVDTKQYKGFKK